MKLILYALLLFIPLLNVAQDTTWFNRELTPADKAHAAFYRITEKKAGVISIKEYTINGKLQKLNEYLSLIPEIKNGRSIVYYENGGVKEMGFYKNNFKDSVWTLYDQYNNVSIQYLYEDKGMKVKVLQISGNNPENKH